MLLLNDKYSTALSAAIAASKAIMKIYSSPFETYIKDDGSPLTKADLESTRIIHSFLDPLSIPITGEESSPAVFSKRISWDESWCIDPLDGTKEFVNRNGEFTVNIALINKGKPIFGLIASPVNEEVIFGSKKTGVYILKFEDLENPTAWKKILPSLKVNNPLVIIGSRRHSSKAQDELMNTLKTSNLEFRFLQKGSALKFFDLALGKADVYFRFAPTMEWDIAAGQAILEALGGSVETTDELPLQYNKENLFNPNFRAFTKAYKSINKI
ncbi:MAG: 3'(2'),5'-bisphosphate nucleotidase CysQ [Crocinitomicaceae bacterium]|nr:3'(2'),5'-bisphosphate nucleotidase CysQ [Flavobacteriia bacterium]NDC28632.1 3'(2'),5'-bisphosphate nucleotidase CysQ [Crocinitomicaceae bacterium]NDC92919.1 3'(2'),5'-bisphosphate nucleotidase CysQ [Flavobacteriales bacterium]